MYGGMPDALQRQQWVPWNIDLATAGAGLSNVTSLSLGIEGASTPGMIYVDAIRLYPQLLQEPFHGFDSARCLVVPDT